MDEHPPLWTPEGAPNPEYKRWREANKPKDLGPSSDFGWQECHGCGVDSDMWGDPRTQHKDDCPGVCIQPGCAFHGGQSADGGDNVEWSETVEPKRACPECGDPMPAGPDGRRICDNSGCPAGLAEYRSARAAFGRTGESDES
jgi:hypothetical protein